MRQLGLFLFTAGWLVAEHFAPWQAFHSELVAFFALGILILALFKASNLKFNLPKSTVIIFFLIGIQWIQWIFGLTFYLGDAILTTLYLVGFYFAIWVGFSFQKTIIDGWSKSFIMSIFLAAFLSAGVAWFQWFAVGDFLGAFLVPSPPGRAIGNLAQPNNLATLILMGLVSCTYLYTNKIIKHLPYFLSIAFMSIALAMTQSRTGLLSAISISIFYLWKSNKFDRRINSYAVALWIMMLFGASQAMPVLSNMFYSNSGAVPRSLTDSSGRWEMWCQVIMAIWQSPWWGFGWNQTFTAQTVGALTHPGELTYSYAHNIALDLLAWNGIPVGLIIIFICIYWVGSRMISVKNTDSVFSMLALIPIGIHSLLEFPFTYAFFLFASGYLIGIIEASNVNAKIWVVRNLTKSILGMVFVAWTSISIWVAAEYIKIEEDYRIVRFETLNIGVTPSSYTLPKIIILTQMSGMLKAVRMSVKEGMSEDQIEQLRKASLRFPYGYLAFQYALALALNNDLKGAQNQMAVIRGVYGSEYHLESLVALRRLAKEKYPELNYLIKS